jgi:NAD(P)H-hydrate epimerase
MTVSLLQFCRWFDEAVTANMREPNAMALTTVNKAGKPYDSCCLDVLFSFQNGLLFVLLDNCLCCQFLSSSSRMVLLKGIDKHGFVW